MNFYLKFKDFQSACKPRILVPGVDGCPLARGNKKSPSWATKISMNVINYHQILFSSYFLHSLNEIYHVNVRIANYLSQYKQSSNIEGHIRQLQNLSVVLYKLKNAKFSISGPFQWNNPQSHPQEKRLKYFLG